jgi:DNA-binding response OmpR family regulator
MSHSILVIDDHPEALRLTSLILKRNGFGVREASSGAQGLQLAQESAPDLVLLDIMMPEMDGFEVCRLLRNQAPLADVPIAMFSARSQPEDKIAAFDAGANGYIVKPLRPSLLLAQVESLLATAPESPVTPLKKVDDRLYFAVVSVHTGEESAFVTANLALCMANLGHDNVVFNVGSNRESAPDVISTEEIAVKTVADVSQLSAEIQALESASKDQVVLLNLGNLDTSLVASLDVTLRHLLVCFPVNLNDLSAAQYTLQGLQRTVGTETTIHALLVDIDGHGSLTRAGVANLINHPVLDVLTIDAAHSDQTLAQRQAFITRYPEHAITEQLCQIAAMLLITD